MDFRNASRLFADKDFDGNPEIVIDITGDDPVDPVTGNEDDTENTGDDTGSNSGTGNTGNTGDSGDVGVMVMALEKPKKY